MNTHPKKKLNAGVYDPNILNDKWKSKGGMVQSLINKSGDSLILLRNIS